MTTVESYAGIWQEAAALHRGGCAASRMARVLINIIVRRRPDQRITATARWWSPGGHGGELRTVTWDPHGALSATEALDLALAALMAAGGHDSPAARD